MVGVDEDVGTGTIVGIDEMVGCDESVGEVVSSVVGDIVWVTVGPDDATAVGTTESDGADVGTDEMVGWDEVEG